MLERCEKCGGIIRGKIYGFELVCRCFTGKRQRGLEHNPSVGPDVKQTEPEIEKFERLR